MGWTARKRAKVVVDGKRHVVVASAERYQRDTTRTAELVARTEEKLRGLERRVRDGELVNAAKIGRAAQRILGEGGVGRLFDVEMGKGRFLWHYDDEAFAYEAMLAGRYVLATSPSPAETPAPAVVRAHRQRLETEDRFRVLKDVLRLRPVRRWTERRVRGHVAVCVYTAVIEALAGPGVAGGRRARPRHRRPAPVRAPGAARARPHPGRHPGRRADHRGAHDPPVVPPARILAAVGVDTSGWDKAHITPRG